MTSQKTPNCVKKWRPIVIVDEETGEVMPRDYKSRYYFKEVSRWTEQENIGTDIFIQTFKIIKIYGKREKQLNLF